MTEHRDGGDAVIAAFNAAGTDYIFSSPGSEWARCGSRWPVATATDCPARATSI